jgi:GT2 family glycosyltransferase
MLAEEHGWEPVLLERNLGYGGGTNAGASRALALGADVIVVLNPDARIDPRAVSALVEVVLQDPMAIAFPTILTSGGAVWFSGADLYLDLGRSRAWRSRDMHRERKRREWVTGACLALSRQLWTELKGFDEEYFLYWEDVDLSHRALDLGAHLQHVDAIAVHDEGGTHQDAGNGGAKSETYYYYNIRNRLLYATKHLGRRQVVQWSITAPWVSFLVLLQGGRRQLLESSHPWRAYVRGLRDGWRIVRASVGETRDAWFR